MSTRLIALLMVLPALGCGGSESTPTEPERDPVESLRLLVLGPGGDCTRGAECPSAVCKLGFCASIVDASEPWMEHVMAQKLGALLERSPSLKRQILTQFVPALEQEDAFVRGRFAGILGSLGDADFLPVLRDWSDSPVERLRVRAQIARARLGDATVLSELTTLLKHRSAGVQLDATDALGRLASTDRVAADLLSEQLRAADHRVVHRAILTLGTLPKLPKSAKTRLKLLIRSESEGHLHMDARKALARPTLD